MKENRNRQDEGRYCVYPPRVIDEIEAFEQGDQHSRHYLIKDSRTLRFFRLQEPEFKVLRRIDGTLTLGGLAGVTHDGLRVSRKAVARFLTKLDSQGLLARGGDDLKPAARDSLYLRISIVNPDKILSALNSLFGWLLNKRCVEASFTLMLVTSLGLLVRADEVGAYATHSFDRYGLATILLVSLLITTIHEFAHGVACKRFGGEVRDMGFLMVFYVLPAFYCNVSDSYRFGSKRERLAVIGAGLYCQLLISAVAAGIWLVIAPYTTVADLAFVVLLGGTLNVIVNCNPLIKLDGYYALSQLVGIPNLQKRAFERLKSIWERILRGPGRERSGRLVESRLVNGFLLGYGLCCLAYSVLLIWVILRWAGDALTELLGLAGILVTLALCALLSRAVWQPVLGGAQQVFANWRRTVASLANGTSAHHHQPRWNPGGATMSEETALQRPDRVELAERAEVSLHTAREVMPAKRRPWRPRLIKTALALLGLGVLVAPWEASTGSDCSLLLPPGRESAARANVDAVLAEVFVQPGDVVADGARIARLTDPQLEDRLTQLNAEIKRLDANASRIEEELRVRSELILSASFKEKERQQLASELKGELNQALGYNRAEGGRALALPAGLAVLQSEIELREVELAHNRQEVGRYRALFEQGLVGSQQYDGAVNAMKLSEKELERARARMETALVEHRRLTSSAETNSLVAQTEARAARSNFEALIAEMHANRQQLEATKLRRDILRREYEGMNVVAPRSGVVLGEDLRKMIGRRYNRGDEILRVGDLETFLLKVDVSEREIADVRLDSAVRFKLKTLPGRTFTGTVSKINAEPATNEYGQRFYAVEVVVANSDGLLRPGMTGFARISFGRRMIGVILAEKLWRALRPELWLF